MMIRLTFVLTLLLLTKFIQNAKGQSTGKILIPLTHISVSPSGIAQPGSGIQRIADGKFNTDYEIFHTRWAGIPKQIITIEATINGKGKKLDKVIIRPRGDGENGIIKSAELWIMAKGHYEKLTDVEAELSNAPVEIELNKAILNPEKLKLIITDSYGDRSSELYMVSLGEVECVMLPENAVTRSLLLEEAKLFTGLTAGALKKEVTKSDIAAMKVESLKKYALSLYNRSYDPGARLSDYRAVLNPDVLGQQMRIGAGFSKYEGITGVVLEPGENLVFVGETKGARIKLLIPEWTRQSPKGVKPEKDPAGWGLKKEVFALKEGPNLIHLEKGGNVYIQYFTDVNPQKYPPITLHFPTGKLNGYFDITRGDTNEDFDELLEKAVSPILDMRGEYIQVAFPVDSLKRYTRGKGRELLSNYDSILFLQRRLIGWEKEGYKPKNKILARVNYHYYMFRDGDGVAYVDGAMKLVADPASVIKGDPCWGFSHEAGHVHQMRQLTWGGMTEVSNNILSMYCTTSLGNKSRLLEENIYQRARETILDKGISYMDFPGRASTGASQYGGNGNTDVFQRLVPFWQLYLYFKEQGYSDFYPDLMIALRKQELREKGNNGKGYLDMLEFCRLASEVSKTDLTEFFQRWGFFYIGKIDVSDYGKYDYNVTESEVDAIKKAIARRNCQSPKETLQK
jgi:hypothetical protein